jgi:hypothetical protein
MRYATTLEVRAMFKYPPADLTRQLRLRGVQPLGSESVNPDKGGCQVLVWRVQDILPLVSYYADHPTTRKRNSNIRRKRSA